MRLLPFEPPDCGLHCDVRTLTLMRVRHQWWRGGTRLVTAQTGALSPGVLRPSHAELNITDVTSLRDHLTALRGTIPRRGNPVPIALTLPDLCGRLAIFEFDALPDKAAECDALLRWRFQKDFNMAAATARIAYRAFPSMRPVSQAGKGPWRVLAGAVKADILEQYERTCEEAGFIPLSVGLAGTRVFDLYRHVMTELTQHVEEYFFVNLSESAFSFIAVRGGVPIFLRFKALRNAAAIDASMALAYFSNELRASVYFYDDSMRALDTGAPDKAHRVLFVHNSSGWSITEPSSESRRGPVEQAPGTVAQTDLFAERLASTLRVKVVPLLWDSLARGSTLRLDADPSVGCQANLTALAGILCA